MKTYTLLFLCIGGFVFGNPDPARGQCSASIFWNGGTPVAGTRTANGTIMGTVDVGVTSSGRFASDRPGYANNTNTYNGFTWRSLMTFRGASFAGGTFTRFDLSIPVSPAYLHVRVSDIRGDGFNTEHQRVQGFLNGTPVAVTFEDPVNGAFITGGNIINGASTTTSTVQSAMRAFFAGPVDSILVTCTGLSDFVIIDLFARCDILLPFQLNRFEAKQTNQGVDLFWTSTQEEGVDGYAIERSADASHWNRIGHVDATRAPGLDRHYRFTDRQPLPGTGFYRLKSIERAGPGQYSRVLTVRTATERGTVIKNMYPNPATNHVVLSVDPNATGPLRATFRSADGRSVRTFVLDHGENRLSLETWPRGYYFVTITNDEGSSWQERLLLR